MPGFPSRLRGTGVAYIQAFLTMLVGLYILSASARDLLFHLIQLPAGFQISLYASVADACTLQMKPAGVLLFRSRTARKVYAMAVTPDGALLVSDD